MDELIKSFGIINISVDPGDATITLGSGTYTNNEKKMTNYGTYSLLISREGYLPSGSQFTIDRETPYYIDLLTLLPIPTYSPYGSGVAHIANIGNNDWIAHQGSGMVLLDKYFSGSTKIASSRLTHIGEGYFLSGKTLQTYSSKKELWEKKTWNGSASFITQCSASVSIIYGRMYCRDDMTLLTEKGLIFTGVTNVLSDGFRSGNTLIV